MKNALYFGDNLNVMREMESGSYHICYLDPPYNSGRNYNIFLAEGAQTKLPIIAEVKSGKSLNLNQVRAFRTAMRDANAAIGIFITLHPVTRGMRNLAEEEGTLAHNGRHYPRLQFWQITDTYFDEGIIPVNWPWQFDERPKAERHYGGEQTYF